MTGQPMPESKLILPKQELIEALFDWDAVELDPAKFPDWVTQGFFLRMGRTLGTGKRLLRLGNLFETEIRQRVKENPEYVYGPAYKGIAIAAATAFHMGRTRQVRLGFDLPEDNSVGVQDVFRWKHWGDGISEVYRITVPFIENSDDLRSWAKDWAAHYKRFFDPTGKSKYGFDTVVGDGSAIPAAAALAMELADSNPDIDPFFVIPRRSRAAVQRAEQTYRERRQAHRNEKLAITEASERLYMGTIRDSAKYVLVSPRKGDTRVDPKLPYSFGSPGREDARMIITDDSILTGKTMNDDANELRIKYPNSKILGGFVAVHIQELGPSIRNQRGDPNISSTQFIDKSTLPLYAVVNSEDIMEHAFRRGLVSQAVHQQFQQARERYHVKRLPTY
ncbi:MAG: hypothetical protein HY516_02615 [Candidatus Aenigmarchaeota archaeon]|nr:hypothetical protein [Candidatus Aenigmarchaeota archaeon]